MPLIVDKEAVRMEILMAFERCIEKKPMTKITLRDIAEEAGMSHPKLLHYFESRDDLVVSYLRYTKDYMTEKCKAWFATHPRADYESNLAYMNVFMAYVAKGDPTKAKTVLGWDPGYVHGCKLAVCDPTGKILTTDMVFPFKPKNDINGTKKKVLGLIDKYSIDLIALGNGTASRESEMLVADIIKEASRPVQYVIVNEAGASVYSASELAAKELPDLDSEEGRRARGARV